MDFGFSDAERGSLVFESVLVPAENRVGDEAGGFIQAMTSFVLHGWIGYDQDLPLEQRLRDVIGLEIVDGTPEIMKAIIARETFWREYSAYK